MNKVALHTAAVTIGENQTANETTYEGYSRVDHEAGLTFFPNCTGAAGEYISHFSIGTEAGEILFVGELTPPTLTQVSAAPTFQVPAL